MRNKTFGLVSGLVNADRLKIPLEIWKKNQLKSLMGINAGLSHTIDFDVTIEQNEKGKTTLGFGNIFR